MSKIYLLLRNNRQTGPFSTEELLEQQLKPNDLVWVEGRSAGWMHPAEIEALKPFLKFEAAPKPAPAKRTGKLQPKHVFVSLPPERPQAPTSEVQAEDLEEKAERLRQRAVAYQNQVPSNQLETKYAQEIGDLEENYTGWIYEQSMRRKKQARKKRMIAASATAALLALAAFVMYPISGEEKAATIATVPALNEQQAQQVPAQQPLQTSEEQHYNYEESAGAEKLAKRTPPVRDAVPPSSLPGEKQTATKQQVSATPSLPAENHPDVSPVERTDEQRAEETAQPGKKGFGRLFNVFKKDRNNPGPQEGGTATAPRQGERKAQQRAGEQQSQSETVTIQPGDVDLKITGKTEEWMMGVVGQKITLTNKSTAAIQSALVELSYYSEDNRLLDKKKISFGNIAPRRAGTQPIPDHRLASTVSFELISATARQEGIAKN